MAGVVWLRGRRVAAGLVLAGLLGSAAWAEQVFIQIEARKTQELAEARATEWAASFPDLVGHRLKGGWFGMALGPMELEAAVPRLRDLKAAGLVPKDSFISTGRDYREAFWPPVGGTPAPLAPPAAVAAPPEPGAIATPWPLSPPPAVLAPPPAGPVAGGQTPAGSMGEVPEAAAPAGEQTGVGLPPSGPVTGGQTSAATLGKVPEAAAPAGGQPGVGMPPSGPVTGGQTSAGTLGDGPQAVAPSGEQPGVGVPPSGPVAGGQTQPDTMGDGPRAAAPAGEQPGVGVPPSGPVAGGQTSADTVNEAPQAAPAQRAAPDATTAAQPPGSADDVAPVEPVGPAPAETTAAPEPLSPEDALKAARAAEKALDRAARVEIQEALAWRGHYAGTTDGSFGPGTRAAIRDWQKAAGATETGVLTEDERARLLAEVQADRAALGLTPLDFPETGIEMLIPSGLVSFDRLAPPFAIYGPRAASGVELYLISRPGDAATLAALGDLVAGLDVLPEGATRTADKRSFALDGETGTVVTHAEARLEDGAIRGFVLVWPASDRDRQARVLAMMRDSFRATGDRVLDPAGATPLTDPPAALIDSLTAAAPRAAGSGLFVGADGGVLTAETLTHACRRLTVEGVPARLMAADAETNLAYLRPERVLAPPAVARLAETAPAPGDAVAVAGYSWPGTLPAAVLTRGTLTAAEGAAGLASLGAATAPVQPGDIGGPVLDSSGQVLGLLMPLPQLPGRVLPPDLAAFRIAPVLRDFLAGAGVDRAPQPGGAVEDAPSGSLSATALDRLGRDLTVEVVCE